MKGLDDSIAVEDRDGALDTGGDDVEKAQPFGTFGGSFHYAKRIVPLIPVHKTYVEPFAGAAAVLHAKDSSEREVIADLDDDVVFLHRSIKAMTPERVAELRRRFEWTVTQESFAKARDMTPKDDVARFYKLVFVRTHARDCRPDGTHPAQQHLGSTTNPEKYLKAAERLKDVTILRQDYRKTLQAYDSPDTFFFIDPPYPGEWFDKDNVIDLGEFIDALAKVKGKFIAVLNPTPENVAAFKKVGHVFRLKVREASGRGGAKQAMRLFVANFPVRKAEAFELVAKCEHLSLDPSVDALVFDKPSRLVKGIDPNDERFVLGIVLEPEVVDAQGDIYSADEIRAAAHRFMEDFGGLGLMHRLRVNGQVKVLESYLAPTDFTVGELAVRKGTWLLAVRVLSDELWERVKSGDLTGFSIGGSARRVPEPAPVPTSEQSPTEPQPSAPEPTEDANPETKAAA
ncbi:XkdF-like putative serine protease domain-containing protein [Corallococcus exercitus]|uniref:XkdF-like putative serine protease domain-containing protein n=1 Tax=Corallococcus exercitus TaxID=2316736 RepID=UPI0035D4A142